MGIPEFSEEDFNSLNHALGVLRNYMILSDYKLNDIDEKMAVEFPNETHIANKEEDNDTGIVLDVSTLFNYVDDKQSFMEKYIFSIIEILNK